MLVSHTDGQPWLGQGKAGKVCLLWMIHDITDEESVLLDTILILILSELLLDSL